MLKTIKVKKKLRLDELIKYVRDNGINSQAFVSDAGRASVYFDSEQNISLGEYTYGELNIERTFTVEVEEDITEDTPFEDVVILHINGISHLGRGAYHTIRSIRRDYPTVAEIHTLIDVKLQLIWETE